MFDISQNIPVKILSGGDLACIVKYPTDQQWIDRASKQKLVRRSFGRGRTEYDPLDTAQLDSDLFDAIRVDKEGQGFDAADRSAVIDRLEKVRLLSIDRQGAEYRIEISSLGVRTVHVLKIPKQADVIEYGRAAVKSSDMRRHQEIRVSLEPAGRLYDKLLVSMEGYAGLIPITHKSTVIAELVKEIEAAGEDETANF